MADHPGRAISRTVTWHEAAAVRLHARVRPFRRGHAKATTRATGRFAGRSRAAQHGILGEGGSPHAGQDGNRPGNRGTGPQALEHPPARDRTLPKPLHGDFPFRGSTRRVRDVAVQPAYFQYAQDRAPAIPGRLSSSVTPQRRGAYGHFHDGPDERSAPPGTRSSVRCRPSVAGQRPRIPGEQTDANREPCRDRPRRVARRVIRRPESALDVGRSARTLAPPRSTRRSSEAGAFATWPRRSASARTPLTVISEPTSPRASFASGPGSGNGSRIVRPRP